jgi:hypothetical protein
MSAAKNDDQPRDRERAPVPDAPDVRDAPATSNAPKLDTSTDWDEWMERQGGRPATRPDVADAEGRFPMPSEEKRERE